MEDYDRLKAQKDAILAREAGKRDVGHNDAVVEDGKVKFGEKKRHVPVPDGWRLVREGKCLKGDRFLNLAHGYWEVVDEDDIGLDCVEGFAVLIRHEGDGHGKE
jgi:hypothetical protein